VFKVILDSNPAHLFKTEMKRKLFYCCIGSLCSLVIRAQTILGIDVSSYEGTINWTSVKGGGYTFAFAKATEGVGLTDSYFVSNQVNGTAAGVVMGAYHFGHPENNTAVAEANYFLSVAGPYIKACNLPPVLDLEDPPSGPSLSTFFTSAQLTTWVQTWFTTVQNATGIAPIIYIGPSNAAYVNSSLNVYGLWIDDYNSSPLTPPPNKGVWTTWDFKQYTWVATVPGIPGSPAGVDGDVFNGTMNAFNTLIGCNAVLASFTSNVKSICQGGAVNFTDQSTSTGTITSRKWTFTGGTPDTSSMVNPTVVYNIPGNYPVKEVVTSTAGKDSVTIAGYIHVANTGSLPFAEDFQSSTFPPPGWYLNVPATYDSVWELCTTNGFNSSQCMYFPANCGQTVNISGQRQQLYTTDFNFSSSTNGLMWFDVAYEPSHVPTYSDTLNIYSSTDCGGTWNKIYSKGGMTLCTTGGSTNAGTDTAGSHGHGCFVPPNAAAWRTDSIHLGALAGASNVMFSFESKSGWGNILYLDNINISGGPLSVQNLENKTTVGVYPNPNKGSFTVSTTGTVPERAWFILYDLLGQEVYKGQINQGKEEFTLNLNGGLYIYRIQSDSAARPVAEGKIVINH